MKTVLALLVLCAVAVYARPQGKSTNQASDPVPILKFRSDAGAERGSYDFEFQTADDIERSEKGQQIPTEDVEGERGASKSGEFRFRTPEGKTVHVTFTAGVEGYRPVVKITE